jgi:hypothetical protein
MATRQNRQELENHLKNQLRFIQTSAEAFDRGDIAEAARLATTIRVLVHDTNTSHSLLGQLGLKDQLRFVDTAIEPRAGNVASTNGLGIMWLTASGQAGFRAPLNDLPPSRNQNRTSPFDEWWNVPVIIDSTRTAFSRKDLVLAMAHKEGGAHVDAEINAAYEALSRSGSLGWIITDATGDRRLLESPVPASVRQVAYEISETLARDR